MQIEFKKISFDTNSIKSYIKEYLPNVLNTIYNHLKFVSLGRNKVISFSSIIQLNEPYTVYSRVIEKVTKTPEEIEALKLKREEKKKALEALTDEEKAVLAAEKEAKEKAKVLRVQQKMIFNALSPEEKIEYRKKQKEERKLSREDKN